MRALAEPLLQKSGAAETVSPKTGHANEPPAYRHWLCCALPCALCLYIILGVLDRVTFVRMATAMPAGVLLMHTLLAVMSLLLFSFLQLARSQGTGEPVSAVLTQLHLPDVISMAVLDVLRSILALAGATVTPGITQSLLLQFTVPAVTLLGALLPPGKPVTAGGGGGGGGSSNGGGASDVLSSLRAKVVHAINHSSPMQCICICLRSPAIYRTLSATAIAAITVALLISDYEIDSESASELQLPSTRAGAAAGAAAGACGRETNGVACLELLLDAVEVVGLGAPEGELLERARVSARLEHLLRVELEHILDLARPRDHGGFEDVDSLLRRAGAAVSQRAGAARVGGAASSPPAPCERLGRDGWAARVGVGGGNDAPCPWRCDRRRRAARRGAAAGSCPASARWSRTRRPPACGTSRRPRGR